MKKNYFEWIAECCRLLGKDKIYGTMLVSDPNWANAWDDGTSEETAVAEFRAAYPNGYPKELEDRYLAKQGVV